MVGFFFEDITQMSTVQIWNTLQPYTYLLIALELPSLLKLSKLYSEPKLSFWPFCYDDFTFSFFADDLQLNNMFF